MTHAGSRDSGSDVVPPHGADGAGRLLLGIAGLALGAARRASDVASAMAMPAQAAGSVLVRVVSIGSDAAGAGRWVEDWARRGRAEQRRNEQIVRQGLRAVLRAVVTSVAAEIDVDEVVARVDIEAVIARIDVAELVQRVLDEVDVGQVIRESSSTMAAETVDAVRLQSMRADRVLNRLVDRVLLRRDDRVIALVDREPGVQT